MITDAMTNRLYLAESLKTEFPNFFDRFEKVLKEKKVDVACLTNTKDIWARDYMPVQIGPKKYVQFIYEPDYLREYPDLRTKPSKVTQGLPADWDIITSNLIVDGGNVVRYKNTVLMCEKVFHENPDYDEKDLIKLLYDTLEADRIIFLPWDLDDFIGHADGTARFIDEKTVLINEENNDTNPFFDVALRAALHNAGLEWEELPIYIPDDPTYTSARGLYLNYLEFGNLLFVPKYGLKADDEAVTKLAQHFKGKEIIPIPSDEIAREGGVLNCISWNVMV